MSEKWQINRVSTSERIFDKINAEVDRPFGIIVYGADCDYKFKTVDKFLNNLTDVVFTNYRSMMEDFSRVEKLLGDFRSVVVVMNSKDSKVHHPRHECVQKLTEAGAKAVGSGSVGETERILTEGKRRSDASVFGAISTECRWLTLPNYCR